MRISRFYHPNLLYVDSTIQLSKEAAHHCINVLRLKAGTTVVVFDGSGKEFVAELSSLDKRNVTVEVTTEIALNPESQLPIHLGQAVSKGDRMEWVLQKATELGVSSITPIITERCNVKLNTERWEKKHAQWLKVIVNACEQCGRNTLPILNQTEILSSFTRHSTRQSRILLSPISETSFNQLDNSLGQGFRLLIGPEGGLSESEERQAREMGYQALRFGPRILRTETAAISAISVLQSRFGDLV